MDLTARRLRGSSWEEVSNQSVSTQSKIILSKADCMALYLMSWGHLEIYDDILRDDDVANDDVDNNKIY